MKQRIKLSESDLRRMISESVKRVLNEGDAEDYEMDCLRSERRGDADEYNPHDHLNQIYSDIEDTVEYFAKRYNDNYIETCFEPILYNIRYCLKYID